MKDNEIVDLYWARSESAIVETKRKYERLLTYVIGNILSRPQDIEECVNDVYLGAWNAMPDARPTYLSAFLCRIAKNLAIKRFDYLMAEKRNQNVEVILEELDETVFVPSVEQEVMARQTADAINHFLRMRKPLHRKIFVRRYYFYESVSGIAACYQISSSAVKSILFRIRRDLKKYLEEDCYEERL